MKLFYYKITVYLKSGNIVRVRSRENKANDWSLRTGQGKFLYLGSCDFIRASIEAIVIKRWFEPWG